MIGKGPNHVFILSKLPTFSHQMIQDWWAKKLKACLIERQMMSDKNISYRYLPKYCLKYFIKQKKKMVIVTIIRQFLKFIRLEWWFVTWYLDLPILLSIAELGKFCKNYYFYDWFTIAVSKKGTFCLDIVVKKVGLILLVTM